MKRKICMLALALALLLVLTGCSCSHEWKEADCNAPKTCTKCDAVEGEALGHDWMAADCVTPEACSRCGESKNEIPGHDWIAAGCETPESCARCGETQGEALGHDWMAANCEAPQTCSRCAATQGEAEGHAYGEWSISETEMTRSCKNCGAEERTEYTEEAHAQQLMTGYWDFLLLVHNEKITDPYYVEKGDVAYFAAAGADSSFRLNVGDEMQHELLWEYASYDPEKNVYTYTMTRQDNQNQASAYLAQKEDTTQLVLPFADGVQIYLFRDEEMEQSVLGTWVSTDGEQVYYLELKEDRTFSGDLNGSVSGTWHLKPLKEMPFANNGFMFELTLAGMRNGELFAETASFPVWGGRENLNQVKNSGFALRVGDEINATFSYSPEGAAGLKTSLDQSSEVIVGEWVSTELTAYKNSGTETISGVYTLNFREDGTFTAEMDQSRAGSWKLEKASPSGNTYKYTYSLWFDGASDQVKFETNGNRKYATIDYFDNAIGGSYHMSFAPKSE